MIVKKNGKCHFRNTIFSVGQSGITIICLFLGYRLLIRDQGIEALGLWSLLLAFGGMARVLDVSGVSALARFVPRAVDGSSAITKVNLIHTLILSSFFLNLIIAILIFSVCRLAVLPGLDIAQRNDVIELLPWMLTSLILTSPAIGVSSALDGLQRADLRSINVATASLVALAINWLLIPKFGVVGFATAQIAQQLIVFVLGWMFLSWKLEGLGWLPIRWSSAVFGETIRYSIKLNGIGVVAILFEPLARILIGLSGGTAALGAYEIASRLVVQLRSMVISGALPLLPRFSAMVDSASSEFGELLLNASRLMVFFSFGVNLLSIVGTPLVSLLVLDSIDEDILLINAILAWGWSINIVAIPLYLAAQAVGALKWNFLSHFALALSVFLSWAFFSWHFKEMAIVFGISLGFLVSTCLTLFGNALALGRWDLIQALRTHFAMAIALSLIVSAMGYGCGFVLRHMM